MSGALGRLLAVLALGAQVLVFLFTFVMGLGWPGSQLTPRPVIGAVTYWVAVLQAVVGIVVAAVLASRRRRAALLVPLVSAATTAALLLLGLLLTGSLS